MCAIFLFRDCHPLRHLLTTCRFALFFAHSLATSQLLGFTPNQTSLIYADSAHLLSKDNVKIIAFSFIFLRSLARRCNRLALLSRCERFSLVCRLVQRLIRLPLHFALPLLSSIPNRNIFPTPRFLANCLPRQYDLH